MCVLGSTLRFLHPQNIQMLRNGLSLEEVGNRNFVQDFPSPKILDPDSFQLQTFFFCGKKWMNLNSGL